MKARHWFLLFLTLTLAVVGAGNLWVRRAKRQYARNRQLIAALVGGEDKQALALVCEGADPNTRFKSAASPTLPLLLKQLLHRSQANDSNFQTALMLACGREWTRDDGVHLKGELMPEDAPLVRAMLARGADCRATDVSHQTAFNDAVFYEYRNTARLLLEYGANINQRDTSGRTPLMLAVANKDTATTRLLLAHGANVSLADTSGTTALDIAVGDGINIENVRQLLAYGADPNHADRYGHTPLLFAQERRYFDIVALLRRKR